MKNRLKISLLITKLSISQHIYVRYDIIRNTSFKFKVKFNHKRFAKRFKVFRYKYKYKTKLPLLLAGAPVPQASIGFGISPIADRKSPL